MPTYKKNKFLSWITKGYKKDKVGIPGVNVPIEEKKEDNILKAFTGKVETPPLSVNPQGQTSQPTYIQPKVFSATRNNPVVDRDKVLAGESNVSKDLTKEEYLDIFEKNPKDVTEDEQRALRRIRGRVGIGENPFGESTTLSNTSPDDILKPVSQQTDRDIARIDERTTKRLQESQEIGQRDLSIEVARIREKGENLKNTIQAGYSSRGFGRSSRASQAIVEAQKDIDNMVGTAERKYKLEQELRNAQIKGLGAEQIQNLQKNLNNAKKEVEEQLQKNLEKQQEINAEMGKSFAESIDTMLDTIRASGDEEIDRQIDINKTKELNVGYFIDSQGEVILDKTGKPIIYKAPKEVLEASKTPSYQFIDAKMDNVTGRVVQQAGYFNRFNGDFKPINFGGDDFSQEFKPSNNPSTQVKIAEYTNIYKGSPYNPEGIDLAGKRGSAIKTPITGEVIYAEKNGEWGNQVKIRDSELNIHQFSHLENIIVEKGQKLTPGSMVGTMGNTGNVVGGNGEKLTPEQIAKGRGTHLDYTVYDSNGKKMPLNIAMAYAGLPNTSGNTNNTTEAVEKGYDTATKLKIYNKIISEGGTPPNLKSQDLSEGQRKSVGFAKRMGNDLDIMKTYYKDLKGMNTLKLAFYRNAFGTTLGNSYIPPKIQQFLQAERDFIQAKLREESGAAIPETEIKAFIQTNGILPGDSDQVIQQKFRNMEIMLEGMIVTSGPGKNLIESENINIDEEDEKFFGNENMQMQEVELDQEDQDFFNNL